MARSNSSWSLNWADCNQASNDWNTAVPVRFTESNYSIESQIALSSVSSAWYLSCASLKCLIATSKSRNFALTWSILSEFFISSSNSRCLLVTAAFEPDLLRFKRRILSWTAPSTSTVLVFNPRKSISLYNRSTSEETNYRWRKSIKERINPWHNRRKSNTIRRRRNKLLMTQINQRTDKSMAQSRKIQDDPQQNQRILLTQM